MKRKQLVMDSSDSPSPANLNNQAESCERPCSARKRLVPESAMIYSRRASLRSAKRIIETEITSAARCLQPQESREHSSNPDFVFGQEKVSEAEKSTTNHAMQMEEPNTLEAKGPVAEDIQASSNQGERANKNPSFSFITEMANMRNDEDEETNSVAQSSPMDIVEQYQVKPEFMSILKKIISKHGDIFEDSTASTRQYRSMLFENICGIISKLQEKDFSKIKEDELHDMLDLVNDLKNKKVNIEWIHLRLKDILEARQIFKQSSMMKKEKDNIRKIIEDMKKELEACEAEMKAVKAKFQAICDKETTCKGILARAKEESTKIAAKSKYAKFKVRRFIDRSLVDDLL